MGRLAELFFSQSYDSDAEEINGKSKNFNFTPNASNSIPINNEFYYDEDFSIPFDANLTDVGPRRQVTSKDALPMAQNGCPSVGKWTENGEHATPYETVVDLMDNSASQDSQLFNAGSLFCSEIVAGSFGKPLSFSDVEGLDKRGLEKEEYALEESIRDHVLNDDGGHGCHGDALITWGHLGNLHQNTPIKGDAEIKTNDLAPLTSFSKTDGFAVWAEHSGTMATSLRGRCSDSATGKLSSTVAMAPGMTTWARLKVSMETRDATYFDQLGAQVLEVKGQSSSPLRDSAASPASKDDGYDSVIRDSFSSENHNQPPEGHGLNIDDTPISDHETSLLPDNDVRITSPCVEYADVLETSHLCVLEDSLTRIYQEQEAEIGHVTSDTVSETGVGLKSNVLENWNFHYLPSWCSGETFSSTREEEEVENMEDNDEKEAGMCEEQLEDWRWRNDSLNSLSSFSTGKPHPRTSSTSSSFWKRDLEGSGDSSAIRSRDKSTQTDGEDSQRLTDTASELWRRSSVKTSDRSLSETMDFVLRPLPDLSFLRSPQYSNPHKKHSQISDSCSVSSTDSRNSVTPSGELRNSDSPPGELRRQTSRCNEQSNFDGFDALHVDSTNCESALFDNCTSTSSRNSSQYSDGVEEKVFSWDKEKLFFPVRKQLHFANNEENCDRIKSCKGRVSSSHDLSHRPGRLLVTVCKSCNCRTVRSSSPSSGKNSQKSAAYVPQIIQSSTSNSLENGARGFQLPSSYYGVQTSDALLSHDENSQLLLFGRNDDSEMDKWKRSRHLANVENLPGILSQSNMADCTRTNKECNVISNIYTKHLKNQEILRQNRNYTERKKCISQEKRQKQSLEGSTQHVEILPESKPCLGQTFISIDINSNEELNRSEYSNNIAPAEASDDQPPANFAPLPEEDLIDRGNALIAALETKRDLLLNLMRSTEQVLRHFDQDRVNKQLLGSSRHTGQIGHLVLNDLCPAIHAILADGLKLDAGGYPGTVSNYVRQVIKDAANTGPHFLSDIESCLNRLSFLKTPQLYFNAFIFALLNCKVLDVWLSYIHSNTSLLVKHYTRCSFFRLSNSVPPGAIPELLACLQPLSLLPFRLEYDFERKVLEQRVSSIPGYL